MKNKGSERRMSDLHLRTKGTNNNDSSKITDMESKKSRVV